MANSPQLGKCGGLIGFIWLGFLKKKKVGKITNICEELQNTQPWIFISEAISVSSHIFSVEDKEKLCTFPEKTFRSSLIKERDHWMQLYKLRCS